MGSNSTPKPVDKADMKGFGRSQEKVPTNRPRRDVVIASSRRQPSEPLFARTRTEERTRIYDTVVRRLAESRNAWVVSGYASQGMLIDVLSQWLAARRDRDSGTFNIVIGHEPAESSRRTLIDPKAQIPDTLKARWRNEGVSIARSAKAIQIADAVEHGLINIYLHVGRRLEHGKVYVAEGLDGSHTMYAGSANLSDSGMTRNHEFMQRHCGKTLVQDGMNHFARSKDEAVLWNEGFAELLRDLMQMVTPQEALAAGIAELTDPFASGSEFLDSLVPHQISGSVILSRMLHEYGFALLADETGSGKTRTATAAAHHFIERRKALSTSTDVGLVTVDGVLPEWRSTTKQANVRLMTALTYGELSSDGRLREEKQVRVDQLSDADLVLVDEVHNIRTPKSQRTRNFKEMTPGATKLGITATPYNVGAGDLRSLLSHADPNFLSDETLDAIDRGHRNEHARKRRSGSAADRLSAEQQEADDRRTLRTLLSAARMFTLSRSAETVNGLSDAFPEMYTKDGKHLRYPNMPTHTYLLNETPADLEIAQEIRRLLATTVIENIPPSIEHGRPRPSLTPVRDADDGKIGLSGSRYFYALQRSTAEALAHLAGVKAAEQHFGVDLSTATQLAGGISRLIARADYPPAILVDYDLPSYITNPGEWRDACLHEAEILKTVADLCRQLSPARDEAKAEQCLQLFDAGHDMVLSFSHSPFTAEYIAHLARKIVGASANAPTIFPHTTKPKHLVKEFGLEGRGRKLAFLTDKCQEGINLQGASAIVHTDFLIALQPLIQRSGRQNRINSPHDDVEVWLPDDAAEFDGGKKQRFLANWNNGASVIRYRMQKPEFTHAGESELILYEDEALLSESAEEAEANFLKVTSERIEGAYTEFWSLIGDSDDAVIPTAVYNRYRFNNAQTTISFASYLHTPSQDRYWVLLFAQSADGGSPEVALYESRSPGTSDDAECDFDTVSIASKLRTLMAGASPASGPHNLHEEQLSVAESHVERLGGRRLGVYAQRGLEALESLADSRRMLDPRWEALSDLAQRIRHPEPGRTVPDAQGLARRLLPYLQKIADTHGLRAAKKRLYNPTTDFLTALSKPDVDISYDGLVDLLGDVKELEPLGHRVYAAIVGVPHVE